MKPITKTEELASVCGRLGRNPYVTVDTEFMREGTYWPRLCLIQMAGGADEVIVDPLASDIDLQPFFDLMANKNVLKVFHAARQDIEIVQQLAGLIPAPLFDTQVAAMVCGFGESVSYLNLVRRLLNLSIDKGQRFTDWAVRPLKAKQLEYALGDVTHLKAVYEHLATELDRTGRSEWLNEEMAALMDPSTYVVQPDDAWRKVKSRVRSQRSLAVLIELAKWREQLAQQRDLPRGRILKDDALSDIANQMPKSLEQLSGLRSVNDGFARSQRGREVVEAVTRGLQRDTAELPKLARPAPVTPETAAVVELLKVLLKSRVATHGVASKLIASSDDLEAIARGDDKGIAALGGWRYRLFGEDAVKLRQGQLALVLRDGGVTTIPVEIPPECQPPASD